MQQRVFASVLLSAIFFLQASMANATEYRQFDGATLLSVPDVARLEVEIPAGERISDYGCKQTSYLTTTAENQRIEYQDVSVRAVPVVSERPVSTFLVPQSAILSGTELHLKFTSKGLFQEYIVPAKLTVKRVVYGAEPVSAVLMNGILVGLPLLFDPKSAALQAFGCTDRESVGKHLDLSSKKRKRTRWADYGRRVTLELRGFGVPRYVEADIAEATGIAVINLADTIETASLDSVTRLEIVCSPCSQPTKKDLQLFGPVGGFRVIEADFRLTQENLREQTRLRLEAEAKAKAAEEARLRLLAEAEERERVRQEKLERDRQLAEARERSRLERLERERRAAAARAEEERLKRKARLDAIRDM